MLETKDGKILLRKRADFGLWGLPAGSPEPNGHLIHCYSLLYYATDWAGELIDANQESLELGFFSPGNLPEMVKNMRRMITMYLRYKETGEFQLD